MMNTLKFFFLFTIFILSSFLIKAIGGTRQCVQKRIVANYYYVILLSKFMGANDRLIFAIKSFLPKRTVELVK